MRALHSTNAESLGRTAHSSQEGRQALQEAVRREEVAGRHGCSHPEELRIHRVVDGPAGHCIDFEEDRAVDQEEHHTERVLRKVIVAQEAHRMVIVVQEGHHMEMEREVHHRETAQGAHRRATELEAVHRKAIAQEAEVPGGKEEHRSGLKVEDQKV